MKTLILKELRENLKVAVVALLMSVAVVLGSQMYYIDLIKGIASTVSSPQTYFYRLQPLTSGNFTGFSAILCIIVGVALGWFQIHNERHRDLWAFLVHRPVTRTSIFLSKAIAGIILYTLTVGMPLVYFVLWVKTPGHVAAPFEWGMVRATVGIFLSGVAWYFAGMLTSLRQARWYGSRALGIGAALLVTGAGLGGMGCWVGILMTVSLALAVWGAFHNRGQFQGQPALGKAALALSLVSGAGMAVFAIIVLAFDLFGGLNNALNWPYYTMGRDGSIYKVTHRSGMPQIVSLDGQPLQDPDTDKPMELEKFNRSLSCPGVSLVSRGSAFRAGSQSEFIHLLQGNRNTLWFHITCNRTGRIEAYDVKTRRFIGSLGPDGFATNKTGDGSGFLPKEEWHYTVFGDKPQLMASAKTIYQVDLEQRTVKPMWTVADNDAIEAFNGTLNQEITLVLTRKEISLLVFVHGGGRPAWSIPFTHSVQDNVTVTEYGFTKAGEPSSCVWVAPSYWTSLQGDAIQPTHVLWLDKNHEITKSEELPALDPHRGSQGALQILNAVMPPVNHLIHSWISSPPTKPSIDWPSLRFGFGVGIGCTLAGLWLGRRYNFSAKRQAAWAMFNLSFGLPGLLAFVAVQEWPAREQCADCGKSRVVEKETCEHCGHGFAPPKRNGTEIFEF